jgi:hypothetical protein
MKGKRRDECRKSLHYNSHIDRMGMIMLSNLTKVLNLLNDAFGERL